MPLPRQLRHNIRDLTTDPKSYLEMVADRLSNSVFGRKAVANDSGLGMVKMTPRERQEQIMSAMTENVGGGGMGALGMVKKVGKNITDEMIESALRAEGFKGDLLQELMNNPLTKRQITADLLRKQTPPMRGSAVEEAPFSSLVGLSPGSASDIRTALPELTDRQRLALSAYRSTSNPINAAFRGQKDKIARKFYEKEGYENIIPLDEARSLIDEVTQQKLMLQDPIYRTIMLKPDEIQKVMNGAPIHGQGFGSFSFDPDISLNFTGEPMNNAGKRSIMMMLNPGHEVRGANIMNISPLDTPTMPANIGEELEMLLGRNQSFKQKPFKPDNDLVDLILQLQPTARELEGDMVKGYRKGGLVQMKETQHGT